MELESFKKLFEEWIQELFRLIEMTVKYRIELNEDLRSRDILREDAKSLRKKLLKLTFKDISLLEDLDPSIKLNNIIKKLSMLEEKDLDKDKVRKGRKVTPDYIYNHIAFLILKTENSEEFKELIERVFVPNGLYDDWEEMNKITFQMVHINGKHSDRFSRFKSTIFAKCSDEDIERLREAIYFDENSDSQIFANVIEGCAGKNELFRILRTLKSDKNS